VSWFSGTKFSVGGSYHDKRLNMRSANHHLKLIVSSESEGFEEVVINAKYQKDSTGLKAEIQVYFIFIHREKIL